MSDAIYCGWANSSGPVLTITTRSEMLRCSRCGTPTFVAYAHEGVGAELCRRCYTNIVGSMGLPGQGA